MGVATSIRRYSRRGSNTGHWLVKYGFDSNPVRIDHAPSGTRRHLGQSRARPSCRLKIARRLFRLSWADMHVPGTSQLLLFNKPYGVLSQFTPEGRWRGLKDFIALPHVYVAGRLDADSEGLLLLTNDGRLQARIADPRFKMEKTYWVQVEGLPDAAALEALCQGVQLNDGPTLPARAQVIEPPPEVWEREPPIRVRQAKPTA